MKSEKWNGIIVGGVISLLMLIAWAASLKSAEGIEFTARGVTLGMSTFNGNGVLWVYWGISNADEPTGVKPFHNPWREDETITIQWFGKLLMESPGNGSPQEFLIAIPYWILIIFTIGVTILLSFYRNRFND